jgi:HAD superfamily phosphoserine phosphatase-like hydrolase
VRAYIDLCGTLFSVETNYLMVRKLLDRGAISQKQYLKWRLLRFLRLSSRDVSSLLVGVEVRDVKDVMLEVVDDIDLYTNKDIIDFCEVARQDGYSLIIVTGAIDLIACAISNALGFDDYLATRSYSFDKKICYLGQLNTGEHKIKALLSRYEGVTFEESLAIGNSYSDLPLLKSCSDGYLYINGKINRV